MTKADASFEAWFARLETYCLKRYGEPYGPGGPKLCGLECWRDRYDEGDTPEEALDGDAECWEDDSDTEEAK